MSKKKKSFQVLGRGDRGCVCEDWGSMSGDGFGEYVCAVVEQALPVTRSFRCAW